MSEIRFWVSIQSGHQRRGQHCESVSVDSCQWMLSAYSLDWLNSDHPLQTQFHCMLCTAPGKRTLLWEKICQRDNHTLQKYHWQLFLVCLPPVLVGPQTMWGIWYSTNSVMSQEVYIPYILPDASYNPHKISRTWLHCFTHDYRCLTNNQFLANSYATL